ncbi:Protein RRP5 [Mactra antiquata]
MQMEEDFPRGGVQSSYENKGQITREKKLFQDNDQDSSKSQKKRKRKNKKDDKDGPGKKKSKKHVMEGEVSGQGSDFVPKYLSKKMLYPGMLMLGCVKLIKDYKMIVGLPNGITGVVPINHISHAYTELLKKFSEGQDDQAEILCTLTELFRVGSLLPCKLLENDENDEDNKSVMLTIDPRDVNIDLQPAKLRHGMILFGSISSQEDHGYIVDIGVRNVQVFLKNKNADTFVRQYNNGELLKIGQCVLCKIMMPEDRKAVQTGKTRVINVTIEPNQLRDVETSAGYGLAFNDLVPGMKVKATVSEVLDDGLIVEFCKKKCLIHKSHLPNAPVSYKLNKEIKCAVLYKHPLVKTITLSHLPYLTDYTGVPITFGDSSLNIGDIIDDAVVKRVDKNHGVYFDLKSGATGFAGKHNLSDGEVDNINTMFKKGSTHRCRILGHSYIEGLMYVTMKESILKEKHVRVSDIKCGEMVECVVKNVSLKGLNVELQKGIKGFIHNRHLADVTIQHPEKKFKIGDKLKCRVLSVHEDSKKVDLTHKKSLVQSKYPIINDYTQVEVGDIVEGYISTVKEKGCTVRFYDQVRGFVPKSLLSTELIEYPEKVFYLGQVVRCKVVKIDLDTLFIMLSFVLDDKVNFGMKVDIPADYKPGKLMKCTVIKKSPTGVDVKLSLSNKTGFIPKDHLTDSIDLIDVVLDTLQPGDNINSAMYWKKAKMPILTCKQSLIKSVEDDENFHVQFDSLQPGMMLTGVVKNISQHGIFVEFADGLFGLVPRRYVSDSRVDNLNILYKPGQTVNPKVVEINREKGRFLASLRMQDCYHGDLDIGLNMTWNILEERRLLQDSLTKSKGIRGAVSNVKFGCVVMVTITEINDDTITGTLDDNVNAVILHQQTIKDGLQVGQRLDGVVLFVDLLNNCVEISISDNLMKMMTGKLKTKGMSQCKVDAEVQSTVELIKEDFIVVSLLTQGKGRLAYLPSKRHLNDTLEREQFSIGQEVNVVIKKIENDTILVLLKSHIERHEEELNEMSNRIGHTLQIGEICTAVISKIHPDQLNITIGRIPGRILVTEIADEVTNGFCPTSNFRKKMEIQVRVIGFREIRTNRYLPVTNPSQKFSAPECSIRPSVMKMEKLTESYLTDRNKVKTGDTVIAAITGMTFDSIMAKISPSVQATIDCTHLMTKDGKIKDEYKIGLCYNTTVLETFSENRVTLAILDGLYSIGETVKGMAYSTRQHAGLVMKLDNDYKGIVDITDISDNYVKFIKNNYKQNRSVSGDILSINPVKKTAFVSLRHNNSNPRDRRITMVTDLIPGECIRGYITKTSNESFTVRLGVGVQVIVTQTDLIPGNKVIELASFFKFGNVVTVKILEVEKDETIKFSIKEADTGMNLNIPKKMIKDLDYERSKRKRRSGDKSEDGEGGVPIKRSKVKNTDTTVSENVELEIEGRELMKEEVNMSDNTTSSSDDEDWGNDDNDDNKDDDDDDDDNNNDKEMSDKKDKLTDKSKDESDSSTESSVDNKASSKKLELSSIKRKAKIDRQKVNTRKVSTGSVDTDSSDSDTEFDTDTKRRRRKRRGRQKSDVTSDANKSSKGKISKKVDDDNDDDNDETDSDKESDCGIEVPVISQKSKKVSNKPTLKVKEKFSWDDEFNMPTSGNHGDDTDDSDDDVIEKKPVKKTKDQIREEKIAEEKKLYESEMRRLDGEVQPETIDDFDRLVLQSPDSSMVWIRYMAFHLESTEIDKARAVAERALKTIAFREEQEKLNVWVAYLNLENMYGTNDMIKRVFDRAVQQNDQVTVYLKLINVYVTSGKFEEAEQLFSVLIKKHNTNKDIWIKFGEFYFNQNRKESARKLLQRSFKTLNSKLHVEVITKFAQMEFKLGDQERGKSMFENLLSTYPKRTDLWSVYIDMLTKIGDHDATRSVYNRIIDEKLSAKKMKFFFKKYLQFEERYGTDDLVAAVKKKALNYVESQGYIEDI